MGRRHAESNWYLHGSDRYRKMAVQRGFAALVLEDVSA
jgi:hypothetical protein